MGLYATGKHAWALCQRCGMRGRYTEMVDDPYKPGLRVHPECQDAKHPAERPINVDDAIALRKPSPDIDDDSTLIDSGTAQAGGATTITLRAAAPALVAPFLGATVEITGGTGSGQSRVIDHYDGSTKQARVTAAWATNPDNTSTYEVTSSVLATALLSSNHFGGGT